MATRRIHAPVRPDWLGLTREAAIEPDLPIVDCHHHLWDRPEGQRYLFLDLLADMEAGHDVRATVFVQSRSMYRPDLAPEFQPVGEVEFANGVAAQAASGLYGRRHACAGIVGFADMMLGERIVPVLEALLRAGGGRLRGIRNQTAYHPDPAITSNPVPPTPGLLAHPLFAEAGRLLPRFGLTLDAFCYHTQLDEVCALADACPDTTIILDHCGGPLGMGAYRGRRDEVHDNWSTRMRRVAERPNVRLKLGGLAMRVNGYDFDDAPRPPTSDELVRAWSPWILPCIDWFGPQRCMFESNFPVDKGMVGYVPLWNAFKLMTADLSPDDRMGLFYRNAIDLYNLSVLQYD
ncbi:amidohydrolase family protein [Methylobacterium indicum]|uniref:Amidohydrolase n=1 Tax=Methylobacterium indicum TaxID=1775910 RepID=A0ABR5GY55_9HYPH|nr:amidohydrolase family protein [Methylobacterium indicum]KMO14485.1 amidohydrolase [Methylobacterium indicum]KMO15303.1 amidohydrolase [Methylobacterium indicum]